MKSISRQNRCADVVLSHIFCVALAMVVGCMHSYRNVAVNVRDYGEQIETKYRYKYVSDTENRIDPLLDTFIFEGIGDGGGLTAYQPNVFADNGIPFTLRERVVREEESGNWTIPFAAMSFFIFPSCQTEHQDRIIEIKFLGQDKAVAATENCIHRSQLVGHLSRVFGSFRKEANPCFTDVRTFSGQSGEMYTSKLFFNDKVVKKAFVYGIAAKLKELEEAGKIDETIAAKARVFQPIRDQVLLKRRAISNATGIPVRLPENGMQIPIEIIKCECENGKDFSYNFEIEIKSKGIVTLQDNNLVKSTLNSAIRSHYAALHKEIPPRSLIVDFPVYLFNGGRITGRCVVLTISVESLSYNAISRKGVLAIRVGANQLDDVRRWIQKNIGDFVRGDDVSVSGDEIPSGVRFRTGHEALQADGVFVIEFMTE